MHQISWRLGGEQRRCRKPSQPSTSYQAICRGNRQTTCTLYPLGSQRLSGSAVTFARRKSRATRSAGFRGFMVSSATRGATSAISARNARAGSSRRTMTLRAVGRVVEERDHAPSPQPFNDSTRGRRVHRGGLAEHGQRAGPLPLERAQRGALHRGHLVIGAERLPDGLVFLIKFANQETDLLVGIEEIAFAVGLRGFQFRAGHAGSDCGSARVPASKAGPRLFVRRVTLADDGARCEQRVQRGNIGIAERDRGCCGVGRDIAATARPRDRHDRRPLASL